MLFRPLRHLSLRIQVYGTIYSRFSLRSCVATASCLFKSLGAVCLNGFLEAGFLGLEAFCFAARDATSSGVNSSVSSSIGCSATSSIAAACADSTPRFFAVALPRLTAWQDR